MVVDHHVGARAGQADRKDAPDASRAPCNQGCFSLDIHARKLVAAVLRSN
jgi:hypothetical protein